MIRGSFLSTSGTAHDDDVSVALVRHYKSGQCVFCVCGTARSSLLHRQIFSLILVSIANAVVILLSLHIVLILSLLYAPLAVYSKK
jgi:hypothetical protein